jgi:hypothetical protein
MGERSTPRHLPPLGGLPAGFHPVNPAGSQRQTAAAVSLSPHLATPIAAIRLPAGSVVHQEEFGASHVDRGAVGRLKDHLPAGLGELAGEATELQTQPHQQRGARACAHAARWLSLNGLEQPTAKSNPSPPFAGRIVSSAEQAGALVSGLVLLRYHYPADRARIDHETGSRCGKQTARSRHS